MKNCMMKSFTVCTLNQILLGDQIIEDEMGEACCTHGFMIDLYKNLHGKPEGKRLLRGSRRRWKNNTKMDLRSVRMLSVFMWLRTRTNGGLL
jgi:hypothetical protein